MDYKVIYENIIEKAKTKEYHQYTEVHHIVPKCLGGSNKKENLVRLSYREHFIVHWILCKLYPDNYKIKAAFAKMLETNKNNKRIVSSYQFDAVKRVLKNINYPWLHKKDPWNKGKTGLQIAWNKGIKTGPATKDRIKKTSETLKKLYKTKVHHAKGKPSWNSGLKLDIIPWNKGLESKKYECPHCKRMIDYMNFKKWHDDNCKSKNK